MSSEKTINMPLEGIRVLDFTWILAGPFATAMMADYGAEVIKVQSHKISNGTEQNDTYYFASLNRNKHSITLDMSRPEARDMALRLAAKCDIVIQNFTPRVMENWGLGREAFKKANPSVITVNLSAMGNTGPWRDFAALADTIEALAGMLESPEPQMTGYPFSDIVSGLFTFNAVLAALENRSRTGQGCNIDISEFEALCSLMGPSIMASTVNRDLLSHDEDPSPSGCYKCRGKDRWCAISVRTEEQWQNLCLALENPGWASEPRFSTIQKRNANRKALDRNIEKWTSRLASKTVMRRLEAKGVPCSTVNNARDLASEPQLKSRDFFKEYSHPGLGKIVYVPPPLKMSAASPRIIKSAPLLGEDNDYVFGKILGMDSAQIREYVERKVIY
jgi:crotonobetainyl-CoA:carnitine CoA-transferase CaiB-like acyl-CoA transferase